MSLDDMQMTMNGQEPPMMPEMDLTVSLVNEVEISDEYLSVRAGRPLEIERTFDSLSMDSEMAMEIDMMGQVQSEEMPSTASSELEGTTVTFKWDADEEEYVIAFTDGEGDTLVEDFSLGLLGGGGVEFFLNSNLAAGLTVRLQRHLMSAVRYTGLHAVAGVTWY